MSQHSMDKLSIWCISYLLDTETYRIRTICLINEQTTHRLLHRPGTFMVAVNRHVPKSVLLLYLRQQILIWENLTGNFKSSWNAKSCAGYCRICSWFFFIVLILVLHCGPSGSGLTWVWISRQRNTWSYEWWTQGLFLQMLVRFLIE